MIETEDLLVRFASSRDVLTVGGTEFVLYPVRGGETADALLIHLPGRRVVFVGDAFMPYLGASFLPEGSAEGLFETFALIRSVNPRTLVHGHPPLTDLFTVEALPAFEAVLRELHDRTLQGIGEGRTLAELLQQNWLPATLRSHPVAVMPFLVIRDNFIQRVVHQRTGYWKPDGEDIEVVSPPEWAAALNLLAGRQERAFVRGAQALLEQRADVLALTVADLGLAELPGEPWAHGGPAAGPRPAPGPASGSQRVQVHRLFGMGEGRSGARRITNPARPTRLSGHRVTKEEPCNGSLPACGSTTMPRRR